jgi:class 3 adenylate cyclase
VVAALGAWFDRIAGAVHAFGGEVLKFIGDGVLAVFPVGDRPAAVACDAALSAAAAAHAGMAHLDQARTRDGLPPLPFGMALHLGEMLWGNIGTADRLDFTAIGPAVNLVSRLEGLCRRGRRGDDGAADPARRSRLARHRHALCGVHASGLTRRISIEGLRLKRGDHDGRESVPTLPCVERGHRHPTPPSPSPDAAARWRAPARSPFPSASAAI